MSILKRFRKQPESKPAQAPQPIVPPPSRAQGFVPPPPRPVTSPSTDPRIARLEQRRTALETAIELVEQSSSPNSPFQQRIEILGETLDALQREITAATPLPKRARPPLPPVPVADQSVNLQPVPEVRFKIGSSSFLYTEEIDWAERGTQIVHGDLLPVQVEIEPLIPESAPTEQWDELAAHLDRSLFAFATDLRDRALEGLPLPSGVTLSDLATICPRSGDWRLWGGVCPRCLKHDTRLRELNAERGRVLGERTSEIEDRQRQVEELPIQRRRLAQTIAELGALQS